MRNYDSLLSSLAGVPITKIARVAICVIWLTFWLARWLLTDALTVEGYGALAVELLGENPFDQGFSIVMAWLTIEVAYIIWLPLKGVISMLIADSAKSWAEQVTARLSKDRFIRMAEEKLTLDELEAMTARKRREQEPRSRRRALRRRLLRRRALRRR